MRESIKVLLSCLTAQRELADTNSNDERARALESVITDLEQILEDYPESLKGK